jgi:hypothetical protein
MRKMNNVLFKNFDENLEVNLEARKSIYLSFIELLCQSKQIDKWVMPYFSTYFSNGKYSLDGNPIFSAINKDKTKIIKLILLSNEESNSNDSFISDFDGKEMLVSSFLYTEENFKSVLEAVKLFIS